MFGYKKSKEENIFCEQFVKLLKEDVKSDGLKINEIVIFWTSYGRVFRKKLNIQKNVWHKIKDLKGPYNSILSGAKHVLGELAPLGENDKFFDPREKQYVVLYNPFDYDGSKSAYYKKTNYKTLKDFNIL